MINTKNANTFHRYKGCSRIKRNCARFKSKALTLKSSQDVAEVLVKDSIKITDLLICIDRSNWRRFSSYTKIKNRIPELVKKLRARTK